MSENILTFSELREQFLGQLDEAGSTGTTRDLANQFLNQAHRARCTQDAYPFMRWPRIESFATVVGQTDYTLHSEFNRPLYFWNATQLRYLSAPPTRTYEQFDPNPTDRVTPIRFDLRHRQGVQNQPTSSSVLSVVSSSSSDTAVSVIVRGMTATGVATETISAGGVTPVLSTNAYTTVLQVSKVGTWVGTLTLTSNSGAVTVLVLFPNEAGRSYQVLHFLDLPSTADTIQYEFYRQPSPLTNDGDVPDIPPPFQEVLVYDALLMVAGYNTDLSPKSMQVWAELRQRLDNGLRQAYLDPAGVNAEPSYIRYLGDEAGYY